MTSGEVLHGGMTVALSCFALAAAGGYEVPEPKPVRGAVEVTAIYFPGTPQRSEWQIVEQATPERKPILGWFDEGDPVNVDWQIKWAVEHGISSFCVDWYWNRGVQRNDHWLKAYRRAKYRKCLSWYMLWCNHNEPGSHSVADQTAMVKFWIDNYFRQDEYYKVDGKPAVVVWDVNNIDRDFRAEAAERGETLAEGEGLKRAFALSERLVKEAGLPGIHWIMEFWEKGEVSKSRWERLKAAGFRELMNYSYDSCAIKTHPEYAKPGDTDMRFSYDCVVKAVRHFWNDVNIDPELPFAPYIPTGWDVRPRWFQWGRVCYGRTPELFGEACRAARRFCEERGVRRVILGPISEWQEGSYIEPNAEYGFAMYDALRDAFCEKPTEGWPANVGPSDLGLKLREYPPLEQVAKPEWDFSKGFGGWYRNPYGAQQLTLVGGNLHLVTRGEHAMRVRPQPFAADDYRTVRLSMRLKANPRSKFQPKGDEVVRLWFGTKDAPLLKLGGVCDLSKCLTAPVLVDGEWHEYEMRTAGDRTDGVPAWRGTVEELWLEPTSLPDVFVDIAFIRFDR